MCSLIQTNYNVNFGASIEKKKFQSTTLQKSYHTAWDIGDLWEIKMDKMHIMLRFSI